MDNNIKVTVDHAKKTFKVEGNITDLKASTSGDTQSMVNVRNAETDLTHPDGRRIKMSLLLYVKTPKA
jgi:hypothetical protein